MCVFPTKYTHFHPRSRQGSSCYSVSSTSRISSPSSNPAMDEALWTCKYISSGTMPLDLPSYKNLKMSFAHHTYNDGTGIRKQIRTGLNIGWVWTACHLSHPFIPFHISVFSEVASFPSFSLWAIFFQLKLVPQSLLLWPVPWPAMLLWSVQVWGASWWGWPGCRGHCPPPPRGVQVRVYVPKHDSLLGVEGEGLCSVPDKILSSLEN